ncbi:MAG: CPBP family intramembrane metalloprotease [Lachnospiraceae bacterium]|nr:CPBP family intramembrane metalloprotease [Lachnospiraceae bacterium]
MSSPKQPRLIWKIWDVLYPLVFTLLALAVVTVAALLIGGILPGMTGESGLSARYPIAPLLINLAFYLILIFSQRRVYKRDDMRFGPRVNRWSVPKIILSAVIAFAVAFVLNLVIAVSGLMERFPTYAEQSQLSFAGQPAWLLIITVVIIGPIAEELVFRGLTYSRIKHYLGVPAAVILSSLIFGIYHANIVQFIYASLIGILLSLYYEKSGSLHACVLAHMAMNAFAVTSFI